jgi:predicted metal-dependent enzyme (double-stranded beta helix superfamily)
MKSLHMMIASLAMGAASPALAQKNPAMCNGVEAASHWPGEQDAVSAARGNHKVIYETDELRVLEVTVQPGETEPLHHHRWPSVMVLDARPNYINYDANDAEIKPAVAPPANPEWPIMVRLAPQAAHYIRNVDDKAFHAIRIEYKNACTQP